MVRLGFEKSKKYRNIGIAESMGFLDLSRKSLLYSMLVCISSVFSFALLSSKILKRCRI